MSTGGSEFYQSNIDRELGDFDIYCVHSFFATFCVEGNSVAFADVVDESAYVNKDFLFSGVVYDEAKTFGFIEKFYCTSIHCKKRKKSDVAMCRAKGKGF